LSQREADGPQHSISVDFNKPQLWRRKHNELLTKPFGVRTGTPRYVIDATAGMGVDAFLLAQAGCQVTLIERSPLIAALLEDGINRASQTPAIEAIAARMCLKQGDAITLLSSLASEQQPDIIYLDPMFPQRNKSALPKKAMQSLQALVGDDRDQVELLGVALQCARFRVVVKRHNKAKAIEGVEPTYSLHGKQIRYDVYVLRKLI
ncbi:MAG: class I SAM-dependent methyltransferase, partial [Pseudomonadales bacterium]